MGSVLQIDDTGGGHASLPPQHAPAVWAVSFGARYLCADTSAHIDRVTPHWRVAPEQYQFLVRSVDLPLSDEPAESFISVYGTPPDFPEPYADESPLAGTVIPAAGATVTDHCTNSRSMDPRHFQELIVVLDVGPRGADLRDIDVAWSSGAEHGTVHLHHYRMNACGSAIPAHFCRSPPTG